MFFGAFNILLISRHASKLSNLRRLSVHTDANNARLALVDLGFRQTTFTLIIHPKMQAKQRLLPGRHPRGEQWHTERDPVGLIAEPNGCAMLIGTEYPLLILGGLRLGVDYP